ncbi:MAG: UbiH/UbiF/VisC/COQ6 family ubiquinone biosynthesis hydroxylase [Marivibrio sp.]|uniref:UbiH/UbiF/VisC/COQ6 family ubiquinone biosynthesis hydroxylase n=1 Tax=Marivibrio sp. TaxID=2039719 RepID=UPI0032EAD310
MARPDDLAPATAGSAADPTDPGSRAPTARADVLFAGGGMVGLTLACALARAGLEVAVIDRETPAEVASLSYDGRASAIALGSKRVFEQIGLWARIEEEASPIWDIRVADGHPLRGVSPLFLHYDHAEVGTDPFGWIIENRVIRQGLHALAADLSRQTGRLHLMAPAGVERIERGPAVARAHLADGRVVAADLAIAADGKFSRQREAAAIKTTGWTYDQVSIVCTVRHERSHEGTAVELFLPGGPFAMLPMTENRSNVVWSENKDLAPRFLAMDDAAFLSELKTRFGDWLGEIELAGPRFSYPLSLSHAETYTARRFALIGDAAHAIHPIAGQGLNMGLRDVAAMAEVLVDARRLGLDVGSASTLKDYERWRRFDNVLLAGVTDALTRLFSNDVAPLRLARDVGLAAVDRTPPAKQFLMRHAMGVVGDLPRMVRGEPL